MTHGVDISDAQGLKTVDQFKRLKAAGYTYVIVKTGEGGGSVIEARSYARCAGRNIRNARQAGLEVGAYHYFHPRAGRRGRDEAKIAFEAARAAGWNPKTDKRFALDYETTHLSAGRQTRRYALSAIRYIRRRTGGRKPWFYTFTSFWNQHGFYRPMGCQIWQAEYGPAHPGRLRGLPLFGSPLSPVKRWQYTSDGKVAGFHDGRLDVNKGTR